MGSELVTQQTSPKTIRELFDEVCPLYIFMGMTYEQFWYGTPDIARQYAKAYEVKKKNDNHNMWFQGAYFYHALCDASPLFLSLAPEGTTSRPYLEEPFPITQEDIERLEEKNRQEEFERLKAYMSSFKFTPQKQGGDENVGSTD